MFIGRKNLVLNDGRKFRGVGTALVTPFGAKDRVDYVALEWLIESQIKGGVNFLVPCGTTGETPTLSHKEQRKVMKFVIQKVGGRVPVLAGTGSNYTKEAVDLTKAALAYGADGVLVVGPYYNRPTDDGFRDYFNSLAKVGLPIVAYNIPGRTGQPIPLPVTLELMKNGVIAGLKWASGNYPELNRVIQEAPFNFSILSGDDNWTFPLMSLGGHGVISVLSNLCPEWVVEMVNLAASGDWETARKRHHYLYDLMGAMFIETNPITVKTALHMVYPEIFKEKFRSPMVAMAEANRKKLWKALDDYSLFDH